MSRKRPCRICRKWFFPHPRAGDRQRVCSERACQRERVRRSVAAWRKRNAEEDEADRLRRRLRPEPTAVTDTLATPSAAAPLGRLDVVAARNAVGLQVAVFVEETARELLGGRRNAADAQLTGIKGRSGGHGGPSGRNDMAAGRGPP